jgi:hypothetical protein
VTALELARHVAKDVGRQYADALMPKPGYFETKDKKAAQVITQMEAKAAIILAEAHKLMIGPWPGHRAGSTLQPRFT